MRVRVEEAGNGLHPSEVVVSIRTTEGIERLVIDRRSIANGPHLEIGYPIDRDGNLFLVELPRETTTGSWRVWINADQTIQEAVEAA